MTYYTGNAASVSDLLDEIQSRAVANGWGLNSRSGEYLHLNTGGAYFHLRENGTTLQCSVSSNYVPGQGILGHANAPSALANTAHGNLFTAPFSEYHIFATSQYIHVVAQEAQLGMWVHMHFGLTENFTGLTWVAYTHTSGRYWTLTSASTIDPLSVNHTCPFYSGRHYPSYFSTGCNRNLVNANGTYYEPLLINYSSAGFGAQGRSWYSTENLLRNPSTFNQQTILFPMQTDFEKVAYSKQYHPGGSYKDVRAIYMENYRAGDTITLGSDIWKIFPLCNQFGNTTAGAYTPHTGNYGLAFLTNP